MSSQSWCAVVALCAAGCGREAEPQVTLSFVGDILLDSAPGREMAQGKTNAGIEKALFLSESTVEKHVNAIFTKLGISAAPVHRRVVTVLAFLEKAPHDSLGGAQTTWLSNGRSQLR